MFKLDKYGELVIDKVLFEASYPILFTCVNDAHELFLCVCCQNNAEGKKWLLTKTSANNIIEMLEDRISIREALLNNPESRITVFLNGDIDVREHDSLDWGEDSIYLPKKDECLDGEPGEFDEELSYYRKLLGERTEINRVVSYDKFFDTVQTYKNEIDLVAELLSVIPEITGDVISSSIKQRLNKSEKLYLDSLQRELLQYWIETKVKKEVTETINYSDDIVLEKPVHLINAENNDSYLFAA